MLRLDWFLHLPAGRHAGCCGCQSCGAAGPAGALHGQRLRQVYSFRLLNGLAPQYYHGFLTGRALIDGHDTRERSPENQRPPGHAVSEPRDPVFCPYGGGRGGRFAGGESSVCVTAVRNALKELGLRIWLPNLSSNFPRGRSRRWPWPVCWPRIPRLWCWTSLPPTWIRSLRWSWRTHAAAR